MSNNTPKQMFKHILIPTDGSSLSEAAVTMGLAIAGSFGARATVLTVSVPFHVVTTETLALSDTKESYAVDAEKRADSRLRFGLDQAKSAGVVANGLHVFNDHPFEAIIEAAIKHGCDLIVMASHGRRGIAGLLLGSETTKVLTHSKIPVMVCR